MRRSRIAALGRGIAVALLAGSAAPVLAWNNQGHMATGAIAYDALSRDDPAAITQVLTLMRSHPDHVRFDAALGALTGADRDRRLFELMARWPDDIRGTGYDRPDWHYAVKVVSGWTILRPLTFGKAVEVFDRQLAVARDPTAAAGLRALALCWVFHIAGDMHQPLHAGHRASWRFPQTDRAGSIGWVRTAPGAKPVALHQFWDSAADLPGPETPAAEALALRAERAVGSAAAPAGGSASSRFAAVVEQSRDLAASRAYRDAALDEAADANSGPVLSSSYQLDARRIAERRIGEAGLDIASLLR
ncbi:S1/P1 nuclease [Glacieibacterium megasporae]|uniref:S1/P1 nuclease n=1 Tax=Glacieibacterium megasporae TaxID=2835787 RepID=UPI001C1E67C7|nr:S1/P1 nuclease [Polymorphobacter megasporae]UAJ11326.1 hypothetical protein KTC28_06395 [Polymorphobacter megasporae]